MAKDRGETPRVACVVAALAANVAALVACGPRVSPDRPFPEESVVRRELPRPPAQTGRQALVGELCLETAAGRPAVAPLLLHTTQWIDAAAEVTSTVEHGHAPRFVAYGVDGKVAGTFDTLGLAEITLGQSVAAGTYVGAAPCTSDAGGGQRTAQPRCSAATSGCGLAVAEVTRAEEPPEPPAFSVGAACVVGDTLAVDIDGDGVVEGFPLAGVLDGIRGPAQEWTASQKPAAACASAAFVQYDVRLTPEPSRGKPPDPKAVVVLDLLGVIDVDSDGRKELVIALRFPTVRTVVVYTSTGSPQRLELAGEAQSFQQPVRK